ncbi:MAG: DMT family transporter [Burkholderiales bacterium]
MQPNSGGTPPVLAGLGTTLWLQSMPLSFVFLWSTGFIGSRYGLPFAEPLTFLALRMLIVALLLLLASWIGRAPWPRNLAQIRHTAVAGLLVHAGYLGGVFCALKNGIPVGLVALITCLQPILTALAAGPLFGEKITRHQWLGLLLGLVGVGLVVSSKLNTADAPNLLSMAQAVFALLAITGGTLYQKRYGSGMDLRTGGVIQYATSGVVLGVLATLMETMHIDWTPQFTFALAWLCVVLSLGAVSLLYLLLRRGEAAKTASLFYLVPPVTALMAFILFDEILAPTAILGMAISAFGVALVVRKPANQGPRM